MERNVAFIREDSCIGCTRCIQACPVDAIVGAQEYMHTVIADLCTGCELCLPPCPMDCIDLVPHAQPIESKAFALASKSRIQARLGRLSQEKHLHSATHQATQMKPEAEKKADILAAIQRAKSKNAPSSN